MNSSEASPRLLDRILDSVSQCFTPETARALIEVRQDDGVRQRMQELGAKASAGEINSQESLEYQSLIEVGDLIAALQIKARRRLASEASV
jgi:hypothetical protein